MELDEIKMAWQAQDRKLERQNAINFQLLKDDGTRRVRSSLRPLAWGQLAQMAFGVLFVLLAASLWMRAGSSPGRLPWHLVAAGVLVHAYGIAAIAMAGCTLGLVRTIDYALPVVAIQKQLAKLRRLYIFGGIVAGLPWWFMWVPVLMVLAALGGVDLYARAPSLVWIGMGVGAAGLAGSWWLHHWSRSSRRPQLARTMQDGMTGSSLRNAQRIADEIARFEQE
ncbi:serine/threonine protein kinase [Pseudoxanthomonas gei]|uniref:Serine/threonine protein kinase n=1 Tax=Pseudoxanthomonas gei TaxID=1383030 RepID=A0ABX0AKV8_9GAMM|nr:serine/threonine protein kinase [Pseudoxanthomonas gei]NDK39879.1 serine/threonine protein kinase [Pseudoxanthomonas gei]